MTAFAANPAAALAGRAVSTTGLGLVRDAVAPLLGLSSRTVAVSAGALVVTVGPVRLSWRPGTDTGSTSPSPRPACPASTPSPPPSTSTRPACCCSTSPSDRPRSASLNPYGARSGPARPWTTSVDIGLGSLVGPVEPGVRAARRLRWTGVDQRRGRGGRRDRGGAGRRRVGAAGGTGGPGHARRAGAGTPVRELLAGVLLEDDQLDEGLLEPDELPGRLRNLLDNLAHAPGAEVVIDGALELSVHATSGGYGISLGLRTPYPLGGTELTASLKATRAGSSPPGCRRA